MHCIQFLGEETISKLDLPSVVDVLTQYIMHNSIQTKVAVLKWIHDLYTKLPEEVISLFLFVQSADLWFIADG